jgi:4-diphosphocytidyl-2-C-methyl-D-erythritol kinase
MRSTSTTTCLAPAKVNVCLRIVGRRDDGYHLLDSIFAEIDLVDRLTLTVVPGDASAGSRVTVSCRYPGVPTDANNLAARAADALLAECAVGADVDIAIEKHIPPVGRWRQQ